jgi:hypothetical protein
VWSLPREQEEVVREMRLAIQSLKDAGKEPPKMIEGEEGEEGEEDKEEGDDERTKSDSEALSQDFVRRTRDSKRGRLPHRRPLRRKTWRRRRRR